MAIRILINGAYGKMGLEAVKIISQSAEFLLVGQTGSQDDLTQVIAQTKPQVVLDLTTAAVVFENTNKIITAGVRPVIGTSGLLAEQIQTLSQLCAQKKLGGLIVPNFSIGAVLAMQYAQNCARYFSAVEIIEAHHPQKVDAPSGTAIRTAEMIATAKQQAAVNVLAKETIVGARGAKYKDVNIHSLRLPGILARQTVMFGSVGETLGITHEVSSRDAYMPGITLACRKVMGLSALLCGLEHVL